MTKKSLVEQVKDKDQKDLVQKKQLKPEQIKYNKISDMLEKMTPQLKQALPKHITPDRMSRIALTSIRQNPKLLSCTELSLLGAILQSAQLGLEPNTQGQAYLVPYGNEVQFQIGYLGLIELFYRSSQSETITAEIVYENDKFEYKLGLHTDLIHEPVLGDRGKAIAYYAVAKLKSGGYGMAVMSVKDVENHALKYSTAYKKGWTSPWKTDFDAMALKTVIKKALKFMPKSIEIQEAVSFDNTIKNIDIESPDLLSDNLMDWEIVEDENVDIETGEIKE